MPRSSQQWPLHQNSKRSNRISKERSQTKIISPKRCWKNRPTTLLQTKTNRFSSKKVLWTTQDTQTSSTHPTNCIIHQLTTLPTVKMHSRHTETLHQTQPATLQEIQRHFSQFIRQQTIDPDEIMVSFDVKSLYTNIPITDTLPDIKDLLNNDTTLQHRTNLLPDQILELLEFPLRTKFFIFNGEFHQQTDGVAIHS